MGSGYITAKCTEPVLSRRLIAGEDLNRRHVGTFGSIELATLLQALKQFWLDLFPAGEGQLLLDHGVETFQERLDLIERHSLSLQVKSAPLFKTILRQPDRVLDGDKRL